MCWKHLETMFRKLGMFWKVHMFLKGCSENDYVLETVWNVLETSFDVKTCFGNSMAFGTT